MAQMIVLGFVRLCLVIVPNTGHLFTFKVLIPTQNLYSLPIVLSPLGPASQTSSPPQMLFLSSTQTSGYSVSPSLEKDFSLVYQLKYMFSSLIHDLSVNAAEQVCTLFLMFFDLIFTRLELP